MNISIYILIYIYTFYIYYNLIPFSYKDYGFYLTKINDPKMLYSEFMKVSKVIYNLEYVKLLEQALREKFKNPTYAKHLINTGDARLYYHNEYDLLLGTNFKYDGPMTNMLGRILEKIRPDIKKNYNENLLYKPYLALNVFEVVFQSNEDVSDYMSMLKQEDVTFDTIIDKYGLEKIKTKIPYDFTSLIDGDNDLSKVLKLSLKKPIILLFYVLKKHLRKYSIRMQLKKNDIIFESYVDDLLEKTNNPESMKNELNYVIYVLYKLKNLIHSII